DSIKIIKDIMKRLNMKPKEAAMAKDIISKAKQEHRADTVDYIRSLPFPASSYSVVADEYRKDLEKSNALDYDDLLLFTTEVLLKDSFIRQKWQERFDYILIDEFQDTNDVQYRLFNSSPEIKRAFLQLAILFSPYIPGEAQSPRICSVS